MLVLPNYVQWTPHMVTGKTPCELFYKRQFKNEIPSIMNMDEQVTDRKEKQLRKI